VLVGDAAHATSPTLSQGAAMAFEESHKLLGMADATERAERAFQRLLDQSAPAPAARRK
jgi:2-polyprenyl-6-methoxyphenol hydroxylase-like FAD-dependent oxidoreductase